MIGKERAQQVRILCLNALQLLKHRHHALRIESRLWHRSDAEEIRFTLFISSVNRQEAAADDLAQRDSEIARHAARDAGEFAQRLSNIVIFLRLLESLQAVARDHVPDFMSEHRSEFVIIRQLQQSSSDVDMAAGKREAV